MVVMQRQSSIANHLSPVCRKKLTVQRILTFLAALLREKGDLMAAPQHELLP